MGSPDSDKVFAGSIPKLYEEYLVPLIFEPYAADLVNRVASRSLVRVLEIAAGTGVVTRSQATSAQFPTIAYCQGTPLRNEIEARDKSRLGEATDVAAQAIAQRFGPGPVDGRIQAHGATVER